jgi:selenium donor protein
LPQLADPRVLGWSRLEDAAVFRWSDGDGIIATIDFFTPIVDDPVAFGAIAAANSLSDIYARGGSPLFALSIVAFPRSQLDLGVLERIIRGGSEKLAEVNVPVIGGHSIDDSVPKIGYAVFGRISVDRLVGQVGAKPGDLLYLTKPIGTGLITTAIKRGVCPPDIAAEAIRVMSLLNNVAAEAMLSAGVSAATDVSGF